MKEDKTLWNRIGKKPAFQVPEGYFEQLTDGIMQQLPEKEPLQEVPVSRWTRVKPFLYLAAMFVGAALIIRVVSPAQQPAAETPVVADNEVEVLSDEMIDYALDGALMDDYSLYVYLQDTEME